MIPLRGLSLFVQVEERTDSRSSLLFARPQVYGCTIPVVPADPLVIISANDEGVILEVDLSFTVARDAPETSVFCYFLCLISSNTFRLLLAIMRPRRGKSAS